MLTREFGKTNVPATWRDYYVLTKPGVVQLLVFTAIVGMLLASPGMIAWDALVFGSLGIALAAASGEPMAIYIRHRLGFVASGEWPVLIVVGSAHRDTAFTVCRTLIDSLKAECPIFGKEQLSGGGHRWKEA